MFVSPLKIWQISLAAKLAFTLILGLTSRTPILLRMVMGPSEKDDLSQFLLHLGMVTRSPVALL